MGTAIFYKGTRYPTGSGGGGGGGGSASIDYSTTEQEIGTWIDGKPLYQKTIVVTDSFSSTKNYTDNDIASAEMLIIYDGYYVSSTSEGTYYLPLNYTESSYNTYTGYREYNHNIFMRCNGFSSSKCVVTVRYTKSTS